MGLLSSLLNLAVVVGAGWFTIYYLIPKIESGELGLPTSTKKEEEQIPQDIADAATGAGDETPPAVEDTPPVEEPKKEEKKKSSGSKKKDSGKKSGKSKENAKTEARIIEYLLEDNYGIY